MDKTLAELNTKFDEILQIDQADLDFGIYRILNFYRGRIKEYLTEDLMRDIETAFAKYKGKQVEVLQKELAELRNTLVNAGVGDVDSVPKIIEFKELIALADDVTNLEESVLSDLLDFFRHYYSEGDFINQPRYADKEYYIPYSGEEVKLHWANAGQYYVKTAERFRDYRFKLANGKFVNFKLTSANTEEGNKKTQDKERRFVFVNISEPSAVADGLSSELTINFAYQADEQKRSQKEINAETINKIINETEGFVEWRKYLSDKIPTPANPHRTVLEKYVHDYTAKNTFDYFIHPKLDDFLTNELDFYIKRRVLRLENIENETPERVSLHLAKVKALRIVGGKIIKLLAQIENFQKKLFLKKKFVVQADYCISIDKIDKSFYPEIVENKQQIAEWKELFKIDSIEENLFNQRTTNNEQRTINESFLEHNPHLLIDTKHFSQDFKSRLLATIENLDEQTDGLLIKSDNFQALNLLQEKYREAVKCIYIDPPYNTGNDGFMYKDGYQHSSWLSMMENRLQLADKFLENEGLVFVSIDDNEVTNQKRLLDDVFGNENFIAQIIVVSNKRGQTYKEIAKTHEYIMCYSNSGNAKLLELEKDEGSGMEFDDKIGKFEIRELRNRNPKFGKFNRPNLFYPIFVNPKVDKNKFSSVSLAENKEFSIKVEPFNSEGKESCWRWSKSLLEKQNNIEIDKSNLIAKQTREGKWNIYEKYRKSTFRVKSVWDETEVISEKGTMELGSLSLANEFSHPKPIRLIEKCSQISMNDEDFILDFFGGSGTTGHAVINLNREDDGKRKFILVEANDYFETVLKPRILKVLYAPEWKDGMPKQHNAGTSAIVKYITLESYEDTMNNLYPREDSAQTQEAMLDFGQDFREDFLLNYLLDFELSGSLLNLEMFVRPFDYEMEIASNGVGETRRTKVNLSETFNYLIGLNVDKTWTFGDLRLCSGNLRNGQRVLTIWRNLDDKDANEKLKQLTETLDLSQFEAVYLNGDSLIGTYRNENETWEIKSIEAEFFGKMFSE